MRAFYCTSRIWKMPVIVTLSANSLIQNGKYGSKINLIGMQNMG